MSATTTATASADIVSNVWKLVTEVGAQVRQGDVLAVLESMKMELPVHAPATGTVAEVLVTEGQIVQEGDPLVVIATADEGPDLV
jgi:biotin carboxyl carrier protein